MRRCWLLLLASPAMAAELRSVEVERVGHIYTMQSEAWFDAPPAALFAVFSDYDLSPQFSSAITVARNLPVDAEGRPGFYVRNEGCVLFFCKAFERYGYIEQDPPRWMAATTDPARSDFRLSNETWTFKPDNGGTAVFYTVEFEPDFWVPPVIGPYLVKRKLRTQGGGAIDRIEQLAQAWQP